VLPPVETYVRELFAPEDDALRSIRARHGTESLPEILISPEEAKILHVLLRAIGARRVLEVGTLGGYSGVWLTRALPPDGRLITIERDPSRAGAARDGFAAAGVADRVQLLEGDALDLLRGLDPGFDAIFLDADKAPLPTYYHEAMRLLRVGGLLMCDNAFLDGRVADADNSEPDTLGMRAYNRFVAEDARLVSALVPVRDGLTIALRVAD
jgi:predicted O-methyltransferase YrrM